MAFSRCGSYRKDTFYYDEYIAIQYELIKLEDVVVDKVILSHTAR